MLHWFSSRSITTQLLVGFIMVAAILILDYLTGIELSFSIFYVLPIVLITWYTGRFNGVLFSCLCATAWALAEYLGGNSYSSFLILPFNTIVRLSIFLIVTILLVKLIKQNEELRKNELLAQRSFDTITTTQRLIAVISEKVISHNSEVLLWVAKLKQENLPVPTEVGIAASQIGINLAALTEVSYSYQPVEPEPIDLEQMINKVEQKLAQTEVALGSIE